MSATKYTDIAGKVKLPKKTADRYIQFMKRQYPDKEGEFCLKSYATLWAKRFLSGTEYQDADLAGQDILRSIDKKSPE